MMWATKPGSEAKTRGWDRGLERGQKGWVVPEKNLYRNDLNGIVASINRKKGRGS